MRISRSRYITICQQFLVTAVVLVVGLSAAGVMTLQIVAPESGSARATGMAPAVQVSQAYADTRLVSPKINQVKVAGIDPKAAREIPGVVTAPDKTARKVSPAQPADTLVAFSAPTPVHGYATVGVTWKQGAGLADGQISVQVRTMKNGAWSDWTDVKYEAEEGPRDDGSEGGQDQNRWRDGARRGNQVVTQGGVGLVMQEDVEMLVSQKREQDWHAQERCDSADRRDPEQRVPALRPFHPDETKRDRCSPDDDPGQ